jgi:hypothetical protein
MSQQPFCRFDRREARRYPLSAAAKVLPIAEPNEAAGQAIDVSVSGVLVRSHIVPGVGTDVGVKVSDEAHSFIALGRVVRAEDHAIAIMFFEEYPGVIRFIDQLNAEK